MSDASLIAVDPPPATADHDSALPIPPMDDVFFTQQFDDQGDGLPAEDLDFDFSIDDIWIPSPDELDEFLNPTGQEFDSQGLTDSGLHQYEPIFDQSLAVIESDSSDIPQFSGDGNLSRDRSSNGFGALDSASLDQNSGCLNVQSPESNGSNRDMSGNGGGDAKVMNCSSPESQGSGNCGSNVSEYSNGCGMRSVTSSPNLNDCSVRSGNVNQQIKLEEPSKRVHSSLLKRKKDCEILENNAVESRVMKCKKSDCNSENNSNDNDNVGLSGEDEKRKVRLMRNRESAQLSRQRKKQYVEELEEKVKMMNSTIQDLNAKISYFMTENATLRQQMGGPGAILPPPMTPQPPGMYPYPGMAYPWMPFAPPYMVKPQGSQVPLVPIPRLKPQQPAQAQKTSNKLESKTKTKTKKNVEARTKKVAGISFIGLLFFIMLFGGFAPLINMRYGGVGESLTGVESYVGDGFHGKHHGRILMVNGTASGDDIHFGGENGAHYDQRGDIGGKQSDDVFVRMGNESEPLVASLYVPRNDKLVRIDGNLVIHSVLASEKAMSSNGKESGGTSTGLAVPGDFGADVHVPGTGRIGVRHPHLRALGSGSVDEVMGKTTATDGRLQQWFREGLAGPMLSSGMCTEVLQFEVSSSSGAIVPSTATRNISSEQKHNSTGLSKGKRNRRILQGLPLPLPGSSHRILPQQIEKDKQAGNNSASPMVVSILVDPREAVDDVNNVIGTKSISRIFVVVLIDSVKYVTYSCILPFKGAAHHLVTP